MSTRALPRCLYVVTAAPPAVTKPEDLWDIAAGADVIELRLDLLGLDDPDDLPAWFQCPPRPLLVTLRSTAEGGAFEGDAAEAQGLLTAAARCGAWALDVELGVVDGLPEDLDVELVGSSHGWERAMDAEGPIRLRKRAVPVHTGTQLAAARALLSRGGFVVPYGALGAARAPFLPAAGGAALLFGAAAADAAAAPGQPQLDVLLDELRVGEVTHQAELYALAGTPPARSPSPAMHNSVFRRDDRDALYVPLADGEDGPLSLAACLELGVQGLSVTTPYKREAHALANVHDACALRSGIVNTLVQRDDGTWLGMDTDSRAIAAHVGRAPEGRAGAFVYGAGGYARAAAVTLDALGYRVRVGARSAERGHALADALDVPFAGSTFERAEGDSLLFNATPAGARDDALPFLAGASLADLLVLDAPYRTVGTTALVERAEDEDAASVVDGRALLLTQAVHQARAFGARDDEDTLRQVMGLALRPLPSLWLVGLRGSGKSSAGRRVARRLGRPFVDLDAEVERVTGLPVAAFVQAHGWEAFRALEAELFERARHRRGAVLATGGGLIESADAAERLAEHPCVAYLHATPAVAAARVAGSDAARPPLPDVPEGTDESEAAYRSRDARYREAASMLVDADASLEDVTRELAGQWLRAASDLLANKAVT